MATPMTEKDKKFYEEAWKKVHYWEQQLDKYRTLYMRDGTISQTEQADLDARRAKLDKVLKDMRDRTAAAEAADAAAKKKAVTPGEKVSLGTMVVQAAENVALNARGNANSFGDQVHKACESFRSYSKSKVSEMEGEMKAGDLLAPLVGIVTGGVAGAMVAGVADTVGKFFVKESMKLLNDKMGKTAKSVGSDSKDLEKAIDALVQGALDTSTGLESIVEDSVVKRCDEVKDEVSEGRTLNAELTAFIEPFIWAKTARMDDLLESRFGIPSPATAKKTQVEIYKGLVTKFEEKHIIAKTSSHEKMEWLAAGGGMPDRLKRVAEERGKVAAKVREQEIDRAAPVGVSR